MRLEFFPYPLLAGLLVLAFLLAIRWRTKRGWSDSLCFLLFGLYLLLLIDLTLFPIPIVEAGAWRTPVPSILARVNLIPFRFGDLFDFPRVYAMQQLGGNILLTAPLGFLVPFLKPARPRQIIGLAILAGLSTELAQMIVCLMIGGNYRTVDINDTLLNAMGVLVGYAVFRGWAWVIKRRSTLS